MTITVGLVDDHTLVRQAVGGMITTQGDLEVVGQANSVAEATAMFEQSVPDVIVLDVSMPDGDGLTLVSSLRARSESVGLVVLTMHADDRTLLSALDAGASALVLKTAPSEAIITAIRRAYESPGSFFADGLAAAVRRKSSGPELTPREIEVLRKLASGSAVSDVARTLFMSESTVKTHISKIYDKLGARNRAGAVMAAVRLGLVRPEEVRE